MPIYKPKEIFRIYTTAEGFSKNNGKELKGVEIFKAGTYRGKKYTNKDIDQMVKNFNLLKNKKIFPNVPIRVDHSTSASDLAGYIKNVRRKGNKLIADMDITEEEVYNKIKRTTLRSRSIEIGTYEDNKGNTYYPIIYGVAWVDIPQVEGLAPVFAAAYGKDTKIINLNEPNNMSKPKDEKLNKDEKLEKDKDGEDDKEEDDKDGDGNDGDGGDDNKDGDGEDDKDGDDKDGDGEEGDGDGDGEEGDSDESEDEDENEDEDEDDKDGDDKDGDDKDGDDKDGDDEDGDDDDDKDGDGEDDSDKLIKDIDEKIKGGEDGAFVDEEGFQQDFKKVIKMANDLKVSQINKIIESLKTVTKSLIDKGKYYSATRIGELLSSLETILSPSSGIYEKNSKDKWSEDYINELPDSAFAVIEPAYNKSKITDKNARHIPYKDKEGKVSLAHLRDGLADAGNIKPISDSITEADLQTQAKEKLTKIGKRYLKQSKFTKTVSGKSGKFVQLRKQDFDSLIKDSEVADTYRDKLAVEQSKTRELMIESFSKSGKTTPAMKAIEIQLLSTLSDEQLELYKQVKEATPKIIKFNDEQVVTKSEKPTGKSSSDKEAEQGADDFIKRTDPVQPDDSDSESDSDKDEDKDDE